MRRIAGGAGAPVAGLVAIGCLVVAGCSSSGSSPGTASSQLPSQMPATASANAGASASAGASSAAPATSAPSPTATATPTADADGVPGVGAVVTGAGSFLTKPAAPTTKKFSRDCGSLVDAGFEQESCVTSSSPGGFIAAFSEGDQSSNELRSLVYREVDGSFSLVLRADQPYSSAKYAEFQKTDLKDDGDSKAVVGTPASNAMFLDALDVVDTSGLVVIHLDLKGGFARQATGGGLEAWYPDSAGGYLHDTIHFIDGKWRVTAQAHESDSQATPNDEGGFSATS